MLLTYNDLCRLVNQGVINANPANINGASIDITLGTKFAFERKEFPNNMTVVDLAIKETLYMEEYEAPAGIELRPREFILAHSEEVFNLPDNIACEFKLKSTLARSGLQHMLAGWCDPGWNNSQLTLEFYNVTRHHILKLRPGMKIGQMIFFAGERVPENRSYSRVGQYNNQVGVQKSKGLR